MNLLNSIRTLRRFRQFKKDIKLEREDPESKFNQFNLQTNKLGDVLYTQLNFESSDLAANGYNALTMVEKKVMPISQYLDNDLDWFADLRLDLQQFYDKEFPTFSYLLTYTMNGVNEALNCLLRTAIITAITLVIIAIFTLLIIAIV